MTVSSAKAAAPFGLGRRGCGLGRRGCGLSRCGIGLTRRTGDSGLEEEAEMLAVGGVNGRGPTTGWVSVVVTVPDDGSRRGPQWHRPSHP